MRKNLVRASSLLLCLVWIFSSVYVPASAQVIDTDTPTPTITDTDTPQPTSTPTETSTLNPVESATPTEILPTATREFVTLYPGFYDDNYPQIRYNGWNPHTVNGLYFNSEHYSSVVGNYADFSFYGTSFSIQYRLFATFGKLGVQVDGTDLDTIPMTNGSEVQGMVYYSPELTEDIHTVRLTHLTGLYIAFDAIEIFGSPTETPQPSITRTPTRTRTASNTMLPTRTSTSSSTPTNTKTPAPVGPGKYDDTSYSFGYIGWQEHTVASQYLTTEHYSAVPGSTANLTFNGLGVTLLYRKFSTFGTIQIYIDGVFQAAINQNSATEELDQEWTSGVLSAGQHTLSIVHLSGTYAVFDAVVILGPGTPVATRTSTNTNTATSTRTFTSTASFTPTSTVTPSASRTPTASKTFTPSRTATATRTPVTIPAIKIDDNDFRILYTGWIKRGVTGLYNNTEHYSSNVGNSASLVFNGNGITILYRGFSTFGNLGVTIDGNDAGSVNQYNPVQIRNQSWYSGDLPLDVHTLTLTHLTGQYTVIDAIIIHGPATSTPTPSFTKTSTSTRTATRTKLPSSTPTASRTFTPSKTPSRTASFTATKAPGLIGIGTTDDTSLSIQYIGWTAHAFTGSYNNTEHYSSNNSSQATVIFLGDSVAIRYRTAINFGIMQVKIDDDIYFIDQNSTNPQNNLIWTSPILTQDFHTLELTQISGSYTTLDAISVGGTPTETPTLTPTLTNTPSRTPSLTLSPTTTFTASVTPTVTNTPLPASQGMYDDTDYHFAYQGWIYHPLTGAWNDTEHYSQTIGNTAGFEMDGSGFTLRYRKNSSFGNLEIRVDGVLLSTISQYSPSVLLNQSWVSPTLTTGVHTIILTHASGTTVVLDAITIR